jgi:hypothetical protein
VTRSDGASGLLFVLLWPLLLYAILITGNARTISYAHYHLLLVLPMTLILGWLLGVSRRVLASDLQSARARAGRQALLAGFLVLAVLPPLYDRLRASAGRHYIEPAQYYWCWPGSAVAVAITTFAASEQPLAVWGWAPQFHAETQMRQATTFAMSEREINRFRQSYFRARYLQDMRAHRPPVFVDETGPTSLIYRDRARYGHEVFPALRELIRSQYRLAGDVRGVRVYVRNGLGARPKRAVTPGPIERQQRDADRREKTRWHGPLRLSAQPSAL